jgi:hypothetical protein
MITADRFPVSTVVTLGVVAGVLALSVIASVMHPEKKEA